MSSWFTCQSWANRVGAWFAPIKLSNLNRKVKNTGCTFKVHPVFFNPAQFFISYPVMWYQKYMKSRRKKSAEIRMAIGLVGIRVALIQLLPRGGAPPALRAVAPRWVLYVFMYGVVRQDVPQPPRPSAGEHCSEMRKAALRPLFCCFENSLEKVKPHFWGFMHSPKRWWTYPHTCGKPAFQQCKLIYFLLNRLNER